VSKTIHLATGLIVNPITKQALVVRKRETAIFMQAGGKIEPGETAFEALQRELLEEIGLEIIPENAEYLGSFTAAAANEAGHTVHSEAFYIEITGPVTHAAEIEEIRWIDPANPGGTPLAPLSGGQLMLIAATRLKVKK
jgi:8-oxo-dGTP diphosphatase